jgi:hypothetical protein
MSKGPNAALIGPIRDAGGYVVIGAPPCLDLSLKDVPSSAPSRLNPPPTRHGDRVRPSLQSFVASRFIMRVGAEYREALGDGRKVFVMGEGRVDDVTTHPTTQPMVEQYVAWYDRHFDPVWADRLLTHPIQAESARTGHSWRRRPLRT